MVQVPVADRYGATQHSREHIGADAQDLEFRGARPPPRVSHYLDSIINRPTEKAVRRNMRDEWQEIRQIWGDALAPIPEDLAARSATDLTRRTLVELGLPVTRPLEIIFYHDHRLLERVAYRGSHYLVIGAGLRVPIGIQADGDAIYRLLSTSTADIQFVNSTLASYLYCLGLFCRDLPDVRAANEQRARVIIRRLRKMMTARDPEALAGGRGMWPSLLRHAEWGEV